MTDHTVKRTLVKSPPELWSELSETEGLARHLDEFGEIRISRLEPEHTVAWEGDHARGLVKIEASGWGTTVTLTAELAASELASGRASDADESDADRSDAGGSEPIDGEARTAVGLVETEASAAREPQAPAPLSLSGPDDGEPRSTIPERKRGRLSRWFRLRLFSTAARDVEPVAEAAAPPISDQPADLQQPGPVEPGVDDQRAREVLENALESLGRAHHRPFSRG